MDLITVSQLQNEEYTQIFEIIINKYEDYCKAWERTRKFEINLKKTLISDIYSFESQLNYNFDTYIHEFKNNLSMLYMSIYAELEKGLNISSKVKFGGRVKTEDSLLNKIYKKSNEQNGRFPINSCINDLLGLRIIDPGYKENILFIKDQLEKYNKNGYNIRHLDRINNGYKAYHIYFKIDNKSFPIELQIWDKENEMNNLQLHTQYKQTYIKNIIKEYNEI